MPAVVDLVERIGRCPRRRGHRPAPSAGATGVPGRGRPGHALGAGPGGGRGGRARGCWRAAYGPSRRSTGAGRSISFMGCGPTSPARWRRSPGGSIRRPVVASVMGGELAAAPGHRLRRGTRAGRAVDRRRRVAWRRSRDGRSSAPGRDAVARSRGPTRVALLPLGVDVSVFRPADAPVVAGPAAILFAGSLEPVKDPAPPCSGLRHGWRPSRPGHSPRRRRRWTPPRRAGASIAGASGLARSGRFLGQLPRAVDAGTAIGRRALLVVTSRHEGQSMVAGRGRRVGLPVVGTRVGVLPDLGDGAITVPSGDETGAGEALVGRSSTIRPGQRAMAAAGRTVAVARFDLDRTTADAPGRATPPWSGPRAGHASRP